MSKEMFLFDSKSNLTKDQKFYFDEGVRIATEDILKLIDKYLERVGYLDIGEIELLKELKSKIKGVKK